MVAENLEITKVLKNEKLLLPEAFPFPYTPENFSEEETKVLNRFFTNTNRPVFAIHKLDQQIVGAMFSRYSRSDKSVRRIFLDEFWTNKDLGIQNIKVYLEEEQGLDQTVARERAEKLYKRVHAEYGDDSVIQMGSVHIAFEYVSQIAAKAIEDQRIGAGYIEKSTRYVDFGKKDGDHYLFMEHPEIMESEHAQEYIEWNNALFEAYKKDFPITLEVMRKKYPIEEQEVLVPKVGKVLRFSDITSDEDKQIVQRAYERALKAKTFDTLRIFLPTTTVTNLGAHFSGQAAEHTVNKMVSSQHSEVRLLGVMAYLELKKIVPSFLQNVDHSHGQVERRYLREVREKRSETIAPFIDQIEQGDDYIVKLVDYDKDAEVKIASQLIYNGQGNKSLTKTAITEWCRRIRKEDLATDSSLIYSPRLAKIIQNAAPDRRKGGRSRRQKLPREFEHADCEVEFYTDFGSYRDLQRNRLSSTERLMLNAEEAIIPAEYYEKGMEQVYSDYVDLVSRTKDLNNKLLNSGNSNLADASEYVTILGNRLRYNIRANLRQWPFFEELRTIEGGLTTYRLLMQEVARQQLEVYPYLEPLLAHINWTKDTGLGRLKAEIKTQDKLSKLNE